MSTRTEILLIDDVTGDRADETVAFALDGATYEIDLTAEHAEQLRVALGEWIAKGRRTGGRLKGRPALVPGDRAAKRDPEQSRAIREWARANGWENLSDRGRIPAEAEAAYNAAHHLKSA